MKQDLYEAITDFRKEMNERFDRLDQKYAPLNRFELIEKIVFGMISLIVIGFMGLLIANTYDKFQPTSIDIKVATSSAVGTNTPSSSFELKPTVNFNPLIIGLTLPNNNVYNQN